MIMHNITFSNQWQYNGVASWDEILTWCVANMVHRHQTDWETIRFTDERDYVWFMMRWS